VVYLISRVSVAFHQNPRFAIKLLRAANSNETTPSGDDDDEEEEEEREREPAEDDGERGGERKILKFRSNNKKKKRNTHRPSGNLIRPRVVDPVRARALRSPFPRDHFFITFFRYCVLSVFLCFSLSQKKKKKTLLSFFWGKIQEKKVGKTLRDKRTKKTKKILLRLF
jgi:hypothetical protein